MIRSLIGYWTTKSTTGHAPPASEETGIRYPCAPTSLERHRIEKELEAIRVAMDILKQKERDLRVEHDNLMEAVL